MTCEIKNYIAQFISRYHTSPEIVFLGIGVLAWHDFCIYFCVQLENFTPFGYLPFFITFKRWMGLDVELCQLLELYLVSLWLFSQKLRNLRLWYFSSQVKNLLIYLFLSHTNLINEIFNFNWLLCLIRGKP